MPRVSSNHRVCQINGGWAHAIVAMSWSEASDWFYSFEGLSRSSGQLVCDLVEVVLAVGREVVAFSEVLP